MNKWWVPPLMALVVGLIFFTVWFTSTCAKAHGGHWWCWLG